MIKIYKKTSITTEAKQIKTFIENNKKIPSACKLDTGVRLSPYSLTYLMSQVILNPKRTDYSLKAVVKYNTTTHKDTINEKVTQKDYLKMINNFLEYCNTQKRVPSYITTISSKTRVSFELFMYCLSKIVVYYANNNTLPNYCTFTKGFIPNSTSNSKTVEKTNNQSTSTKPNTNNCNNPYTSTPHLMDENMGQDTKYGCANNAEQQELYKLTGKIFKESFLAQLSGTTSKGTDHNGINTCIAAIAKKLGIKLTVKWVNFSDLGKTTEERFEALAKIICQPNKGVITHIAYPNGGEEEFNPNKVWFGHYESIHKIDIKAKTVEVLNSLGYKRADGGFKGHLQKRSYKVEASYLRHTPGGQPSICIITK